MKLEKKCTCCGEWASAGLSNIIGMTGGFIWFNCENCGSTLIIKVKEYE